MALITKQQVTAAGLLPVYSTPTVSDTFLPDTGQFLHVKNASGGSINVTLVDSGATPAGNAGTSAVVAVPAGSERAIFVDPSLASAVTGLSTVTYSAVTSVTSALIRNVS